MKPIILFFILLIIGLPAEAQLTVGLQTGGKISVCADKEMMHEVAKAEAEHGFETAGMAFSLLAAFGICANIEAEYTPIRILGSYKTARGTLTVLEIKIDGQTVYTATTEQVIAGLPV